MFGALLPTRTVLSGLRNQYVAVYTCRACLASLTRFERACDSLGRRCLSIRLQGHWWTQPESILALLPENTAVAFLTDEPIDWSA